MKTVSKIYIVIIKLLVVFVLIGYLVFKIKNEPILEVINELRISSYLAFLPCIILMLVNWGIEARKWQLLIKPSQTITYYTAYKSVLAGLSTGLLTPNRLGNFIGRLAFIKKENHTQAIVNTQLGNLAQFISTILMGLIGLFILVSLKYDILNQTIIISSSITVLVLGCLIYFRPLVIDIYPFNKLFSDKTKSSIIFVNNLKNSLKLNVLLLSLIRYMIFSIQYYSLFFVFEPIHNFKIFSLIATTFLITTLIPSFFFGKLFVRESVAVFVFSLVNFNTTYVLLVAFILWIINLAVPAIFGSLFWLKQKQHV